LAERSGKPLDQLNFRELQSVEKKLSSDALKVFDFKQALTRRKIIGAPGTAEVRAQLAKWHRRLRKTR
jgi:argininosuccinate lyase